MAAHADKAAAVERRLDGAAGEEATCSALEEAQRLVSTTAGANAFIAKGRASSVVKAMQKYPSSARVQMLGCRVIEMFERSFNTTAYDYSQRLSRYQAVLTAMTSHAGPDGNHDVELLLENGCAALLYGQSRNLVSADKSLAAVLNALRFQKVQGKHMSSKYGGRSKGVEFLEQVIRSEAPQQGIRTVISTPDAVEQLTMAMVAQDGYELPDLQRIC